MERGGEIDAGTEKERDARKGEREDAGFGSCLEKEKKKEGKERMKERKKSRGKKGKRKGKKRRKE